jgi:large subunit ribosomal protein L1
MPNPKMGTVTKDVAKAVKAAKEGALQFKTDKKGVIQGALGKVSFTKEALLENIRSFMVALMDAKPEGFKGKYLKSINLSSTMGAGVRVDLGNVDPSNPRFMLDLPPVPPKTKK